MDKVIMYVWMKGVKEHKIKEKKNNNNNWRIKNQVHVT